MSGKCLPAGVLVRKLLEQRACLQGEVEAGKLGHLREAVLGFDSPVQASLQFANGDDGHAYCDIKVSVEVSMQCQRCLEPVSVALATDSQVRLVDDVQAPGLAKDVEPVLLDKGELDIASLVEEELLLALPIIARHRAAPAVESAAGTDAVAVDRLCLPGAVTLADIDSDSEGFANNVAEHEAELQQGQGHSGARAAPSTRSQGVTRRSDIGEDNPFNVLQSLVGSSEQEQNHGSSKE